MKITTHPDHLSYYKKALVVEQAVEEFLQRAGYLKTHLPSLSPALVPESYLEVFETEYRYFDERRKLYLTPSPELFLKRILAYGMGSCYSLASAFRNGEKSSSLHGGEFTMLEYYRLQANYMDIAAELLKLLARICQAVNQSNTLTYNGVTVSFATWEKLSVEEAFMKYAGIKKDVLFDHEQFIQAAAAKGYRTDGFSYEDIFSQMYTQEVEPKLGMNGSPTLLYDYPKEFAALAKLNPDRKTAQRFEFYIAGIELGDCYTELTDWKEQEERFAAEDRLRTESGKISHPVDKGFIEALQYGLPDCAGIAIGFDRLAMIFANAPDIHSIRLITF